MSILERSRPAVGRAIAWSPSLGAWPEAGGTRFRVWAPEARTVEVVREPEGQVYPLDRADDGTFGGLIPEVAAGDRYRYRVDGRGPFPDPASRSQPEGVHGPSEVVDPARFRWSDEGWGGVSAEDLTIYELHVGTFTPEGTFAAATAKLATLRDLGVTAVELMPVADFAGRWNWGYDGVDLFAPAHAYGTPDDLRRLVDEAHRFGLGVIIDVVYNHFGPTGNYTLEFSKQYLSDKKNDWAACVNLDGEGSEMVQAFFIENALHWIHEYHADGLRLDATHALIDETPPHFLAVLAERVRAASPGGKPVHLIAEDHRNLATMLRPPADGGWGLDGVWADDFHHQMRRFLAGDNEGYYRDYTGTLADVAETLNQGWFYTGQHSIHMDEPRGTDPIGLPPRRFVIELQNHDQVGNRAFGERLHHQVDLDAYRAATAVLLLAPQTPMLFMGQEWACLEPFLYFTDHEEELGRAVTEGRRREFRHFMAFVDPEARSRIPDPQAKATFQASRIDWDELGREPHASTWRLHQALLKLRRAEPALRRNEPDSFEASALGEETLALRRDDGQGGTLWLIARLRGSGSVDLGRQIPEGMSLEIVLTTEDAPFSPDPQPPTVDPSRVVQFHRPSAVVLRQRG